MKHRILTAAVALVATVATVAVAAPAQAKTVDSFDRSAFDATPTATAAGWSISAATSGELGGWLDMTVRALDGTTPAAGGCEPAAVDAVLTVAPGETFTIHTTAELCAHVVDGSPSLFGGFDSATYAGSRKKARLVGDGFVGFGAGFLGAQGSVTLAVRW